MTMKATLGVTINIFLLILLTTSAGYQKSNKNIKRPKLQKESVLSVGSSVSIRDNPFVLALIILYERYSLRFCGATIISNYFALTAAHCLSRKKVQHAISIGKVVLRGGATNIQGGTGYDHRIYGYIIHTEFNSSQHYNDIAVIKVKDIFNNTFESAAQYASKDYTPTGTLSVLAWRERVENGTRSKRLTVFNIAVANCLNFRIPNLPGWFCAIPSPRYTCFGNAGGPVLDNDTLIGMVSWSQSCQSRLVSTYTNIAYYIDWIRASLTNIVTIDK